MMLDQFLFVGGVKLRVFHVLEQEATCIRFLVLIQVQLSGGVAVLSVQNPVQVELSRGLLRLAGCRGATQDEVGRRDGAILPIRTQVQVTWDHWNYS